MRTILAALIALCGLFSVASAEPVWVVSNGFHSSIVLRARDLSPELATLSSDRRADYVLFGWGAQIWYAGGLLNPLVTCRAIFLPVASAMHVIPFRGAVARRFAHSDVYRIEVSKEGIQQLTRFIAATVKHDRSGKPVFLRPGYFQGSRFFDGRDKFWFPGTCNVWCARALRSAGVPVGIWRSIAASELTWQVRQFGRCEQVKRPPVDGF